VWLCCIYVYGLRFNIVEKNMSAYALWSFRQIGLVGVVGGGEEGEDHRRRFEKERQISSRLRVMLLNVLKYCISDQKSLFHSQKRNGNIHILQFYLSFYKLPCYVDNIRIQYSIQQERSLCSRTFYTFEILEIRQNTLNLE
jgi:hypothetical protein